MRAHIKESAHEQDQPRVRIENVGKGMEDIFAFACVACLEGQAL